MTARYTNVPDRGAASLKEQFWSFL